LLTRAAPTGGPIPAALRKAVPKFLLGFGDATFELAMVSGKGLLSRFELWDSVADFEYFLRAVLLEKTRLK
jgi:hypothetical protein